MFWVKKTIESEEFKRLYALYEEQRIKLEAIDIELQLYKRKLRARAGIGKEEEKKESKEAYMGVCLPDQ